MSFLNISPTRTRSRDKSPTNEIESGQSLQSFSSNSAITSSSRGDFDKVSIVPLAPLQQDGRSPQPKAYQLNLLTLQDLSQEPALRVKTVPVNVTVGVKQRFWLIHQASGLRLPEQFSLSEVEHIFKITEFWDWEIIDSRPRNPRCSHRLFCLLSAVCTPQKALEVAA